MPPPPLLSWEKITLRLRNPFSVSYGTSDTRDAFWIRLAGDEGWGEGTIPPYYRVDSSAMVDYWRRAAASGRALPESVDQVAAWVPGDGPSPARCAVELALLDRIGKRRGMPLFRLLDLPQPSVLATAFTLSIDTPQAMAKMARQIADYPVIKIKLGADAAGDEARVAAVREARPDARLYIDANAGWTVNEALAGLRWLEKYNIELIEQPVAKDQHEAMGEVQRGTSIVVMGDESVQSLVDVEKLAAAGVKGINLKLMKVGGVLPGLAILKRAREHGMKIMLGCMMETSIGITAMAHLASLADFVDLDAPLLIANDPFDGVAYDRNARMSVPFDRPGIGVVAK
jgi:L-alanine-DL-glutamate epimerase-like enolase superfamily enzyme